MSQGLHNPTPAKVATTLTIVSGAMCTGVVTFGIVAFVLGQNQAPSDTALISLLSVGVAVMCVIIGSILPSLLLPTMLKNIQQQPVAMPAEESLLRAYFTTHVIKLALLEAPAFFALVAYLLEHHVWVVGIAVASVVLMLAQIPSTTTIEDWLRHQQESLEFEQHH